MELKNHTMISGEQYVEHKQVQGQVHLASKPQHLERLESLHESALGLVSTQSFPAIVGVADMMLKSAGVTLVGYEKIGSGLCTAIIRGRVADVAVAVEAGMYEAQRIGDLHAVMVIPRPLDDLEQTLPVASCWLEDIQPLLVPQQQPQPLRLPQKQAQEFVELPLERTLSTPSFDNTTN